MRQQNARIMSTDLGWEDHGIPTAQIRLDLDDDKWFAPREVFAAMAAKALAT